MTPSGVWRLHAEHMVDRPDVEAPQGVELTGTNSRTATHTPPHKGWQDKHSTRMTGRHPAHHTTDPSAHTRPPSGPQPTTQPPGTPDKDPRDDNQRFAAAMAQGRRPDPFRTRKRRPGTAMVLHPTGCGRVARRRTNTPRRGRDATHAPPPPFIPKTHQPALPCSFFKRIRPPHTVSTVHAPWRDHLTSIQPYCVEFQHQRQLLPIWIHPFAILYTVHRHIESSISHPTS